VLAAPSCNENDPHELLLHVPWALSLMRWVMRVVG